MNVTGGSKSFRAAILTGAMLCVAVPTAGWAQKRPYNIASQSLSSALKEYGRTSGHHLLFTEELVRGKTAPSLQGSYEPEDALNRLLNGSGLRAERGATGTIMIRPIAARSFAPAAEPAAPGDGAAQSVAASDIVVTAQKREERIQDVPIAISAISGEALDNMKIESGADIVRAVPNLNYTKTFSSMYNITIRGIGTKALNSSSDPGVAVAYNNSPLIRNRLFEQEFFDVQRVEVLRGPQGTLFGRNATAGVLNVVPQLPELADFSGAIRGEVGSYETRRLSGMLNIPLGDNLAIRGAGALTKREGFDFNTFTNNRVNGRDLWSTRLSALWEPDDRVKISAIWERFNEDDDRARSGKALCTTDLGPATIGAQAVHPSVRGSLSQGCLNASLYDDAAFGVPNASSLPLVFVPQVMGQGSYWDPNSPTGLSFTSFLKPGDAFAGVTQSRNVREIATALDPKFRAKNDIFQFNADFELGHGLSLVSQTSYSRDRWSSSQDYNRFVSNPVFNDPIALGGMNQFFVPFVGTGWAPGGVYTDPQLGPSDRILGLDLNQTRTRQWNQELRVQSDWDGPVNFLAGANYLDFKTKDDYYAFNNIFSLLAEYFYNFDADKAYGFDNPEIATKPCSLAQANDPNGGCMYIDRNPIGQLDDQGHNYFLSRNFVRTKSLGLFGEIYYKPSDDLKFTFGLRYTSDKKYQSQIPSQLLLNKAFLTGGQVNSGYPRLADINQKWGEFTGRFVADWKPYLSFTDDTLLYFSASRGYKAGGANPPRVDFNPEVIQYLPLPNTYKPEFVNAFEIGTKNVFENGKITLNAAAFYYDYKNYQASQVTDRITQTENFPAQVWGAEFEAMWNPSRAFRLDASLGLLRTRLKNGAQSIDVMNRTQGNPDWTVVRPWIQVPSNCVAPTKLVEQTLKAINDFGFAANGQDFLARTMLASLCQGAASYGTYNPDSPIASVTPYWAFTGFTYDPLAPYNPATVGLNIADGGSGAPNGGRGFYADLKGKELPNAPRMTFNIGAQYTFFIDDGDWELTLRGDYYRQSKSWARVYNQPIDRLKSWGNTNASITLTRPEDSLSFQFYVKNIFDKQPITDVFLSADDIGIPANTFYLDPRIIGFNVTKKF